MKPRAECGPVGRVIYAVTDKLNMWAGSDENVPLTAWYFDQPTSHFEIGTRHRDDPEVARYLDEDLLLAMRAVESEMRRPAVDTDSPE